VIVTFAPAAGGTRLILTHEKVWADFAERTGQGWTMILAGLTRALA
jgi:hypothetical protein